MNPVIDKVAEAIRQADPFKMHHNQQRNRYLDDYRLMASAAIEALGLTKDVESIPVHRQKPTASVMSWTLDVRYVGFVIDGKESDGRHPGGGEA